jgi:Fe-S oxidoreductase
MESNLAVFKDQKIRAVLVTSPHCLTTFKREYPALNGETEIIHLTQYLAGLLEKGKLPLKKGLNKKIVYHDPCYLGRHNGIYDEPRRVLASIPGVALLDEVQCRENSLCCGGGGGRIWMEEHHLRINHQRMDEAIAVSANTVVTACPYCLIMMEDAIKDKEKSETMKALDISEIVAKSI